MLRQLILAAIVTALSWSSSAADPIQWPVSEGGNGHWYERVDQYGVHWSEANTAASSHIWLGVSGHLATITSPEENAWIWDHLSHPVGRWLGGLQTPGSVEPAGGTTWITGEPWDYVI